MSAEITSYTLTLPGPKVTRSINIEHVRNYLRAQGWLFDGSEDGTEVWYLNKECPETRRCYWVRPSSAVVKSIVELEALDKGVTSGEMLARMVDGTEGKNDAGADHEQS